MRSPANTKKSQPRMTCSPRSSSACHAYTRATCAQAGFEPWIAFETDDIAFTCALVDAGLAAAIMPRTLLRTAPSPVRTARPRPEVAPRLIHAAVRPSRARTPAATAFIEALQAEALAAA